jgi:hypothetical protein
VITPKMIEAFQQFKAAAQDGAIGLIETTEIATGRVVTLIVVVLDDGTEQRFYPVGEFFPEEDPLSRFATPEHSVALNPEGETIQ